MVVTAIVPRRANLPSATLRLGLLLLPSCRANSRLDWIAAFAGKLARWIRRIAPTQTAPAQTAAALRLHVLPIPRGLTRTGRRWGRRIVVVVARRGLVRAGRRSVPRAASGAAVAPRPGPNVPAKTCPGPSPSLVTHLQTRSAPV